MTTDPDLMPDFRDGLEQALRRRAVAPAPAAAPVRSRFRRPTRTFAWPAGLASIAAVIVVAVVLVLSGSSTPPGSREAVAGPLILSQPTVPVPAGIEPGIIVRNVLGSNATYLSAIRIPLGNGSAFALRSQRGWCLLIPRVTTGCTTSAEIDRIGIYAAVPAIDGQPAYALILVPPSVAAPSIESSNGTKRTLRVSPLGVVLAQDVKAGDTIVRHATDGADESNLIP